MKLSANKAKAIANLPIVLRFGSRELDVDAVLGGVADSVVASGLALALRNCRLPERVTA